MSRHKDEIFMSHHEFAIDDAIDALGFNGGDPKIDTGDLFIAADRAHSALGHRPELRQRLLSYLMDDLSALEARPLTEGEKASSLLGSFVWRVTLLESPLRPTLRHEALISRSLQNIRIARDEYGYGEERKFYDKYAHLTEKSRDHVDMADFKYLRKLCRYAEADMVDSRRHKVTQDYPENKQTRPWLSHIVNGLASIAMVQGYRIQPPENQQDENGAWQLPDETIHPDETDEI